MEHLTELQQVGVPLLALLLGVLAGTGGGGGGGEGGTEGGHQDWRSPGLHQPSLAGAGAPHTGPAAQCGQTAGLAGVSLMAGRAGLGPALGGETDFSLELHHIRLSHCHTVVHCVTLSHCHAVYLTGYINRKELNTTQLCCPTLPPNYRPI